MKLEAKENEAQSIIPTTRQGLEEVYFTFLTFSSNVILTNKIFPRVSITQISKYRSSLVHIDNYYNFSSQ